VVVKYAVTGPDSGVLYEKIFRTNEWFMNAHQLIFIHQRK